MTDLLQRIQDIYARHQNTLTFDDIVAVRIANKQYPDQVLSIINPDRPFYIEVINKTPRCITVELLHPTDLRCLSVSFTVDSYQSLKILSLDNWKAFNYDLTQLLVRVRVIHRELKGSFSLSEYQDHGHNFPNPETVYDKIIDILPAN